MLMYDSGERLVEKILTHHSSVFSDLRIEICENRQTRSVIGRHCCAVD